MTDDVKERVARAIYAAYAGDPDDCDVDELSRVSMDVAKDDAHAALSALRPGDEIDLGEFGTVVLVPKEPTAEMITAGVNQRMTTYIGTGNTWPQDTASLYRAMLAAVKEPTNDRP